MSRAPITIHYGGRTWSIRPFTLDQCEEAEVALNGTVGAPSMRTSRGILAAALRRDHPAEADRVQEFETTPAEVTRAVAAVLRQGGFLFAAEGALTGEAPAAAGTDAPTGPSSVPA